MLNILLLVVLVWLNLPINVLDWTAWLTLPSNNTNCSYLTNRAVDMALTHFTLVQFVLDIIYCFLRLDLKFTN